MTMPYFIAFGYVTGLISLLASENLVSLLTGPIIHAIIAGFVYLFVKESASGIKKEA